MAFMITHFYENGTSEQYETVRAAVHPTDGLPDGQIYHAAGPTDGGYLVIAVWDSKESSDRFVNDTLMPILPTMEGGFTGPPQERQAEIERLITA